MAHFSCAHLGFHCCAGIAFLCKIYVLFPESFKGSAQSSWDSDARRLVVYLSFDRCGFRTERLWSIVSSSACSFYWQSSADGCLNHRRRFAWHSCFTNKNKSFSTRGSSWVRDPRTDCSYALSITICLADVWRNPFVSRTRGCMGLAGVRNQST